MKVCLVYFSGEAPRGRVHKLSGAAQICVKNGSAIELNGIVAKSQVIRFGHDAPVAGVPRIFEYLLYCRFEISFRQRHLASSVIGTESVDVVAEPIASWPQGSRHIQALLNAIRDRGHSRQITRKLYLFFARLHQYCALASKPTHEQTKLEDDVVSRDGPVLTAHGGQVICVRYRYSKV
ncbi:hypothetical protein FGO68_gene1815 [Halteria grandinella]|uniref:Uncharacterized protein n=1 Tax=Halteria grandinella TaxID=5974 RepID=A0A8J8SUG6_HALGN|nr:hypothetical protein FGO68_gene1815 [Halteria grandinella]